MTQERATAKLAVSLLSVGLMAAGVLSTRQSRLQASHEITAARLRIREHDERLLELRAQIAAEVSPESVRTMLDEAGLGPMSPLAERVELPAPAAVIGADNAPMADPDAGAESDLGRDGTADDAT